MELCFLIFWPHSIVLPKPISEAFLYQEPTFTGRVQGPAFGLAHVMKQVLECQEALKVHEYTKILPAPPSPTTLTSLWCLGCKGGTKIGSIVEVHHGGLSKSYYCLQFKDGIEVHTVRNKLLTWAHRGVNGSQDGGQSKKAFLLETKLEQHEHEWK